MKYLLFIILICSPFFIGKDIYALKLPGCSSNNIGLDYETVKSELKDDFGLLELEVDIDTARSTGGCSNGSKMGTEFILKYSSGQKIGYILVDGKTRNISIKHDFEKTKYLFFFYKYLWYIMSLIIIYIIFYKYVTRKNPKN